MCYSHVDVWFILIHSHHFNTYVSFQKDCLCVHHPDVLPNLMQLRAKWFLRQIATVKLCSSGNDHLQHQRWQNLQHQGGQFYELWPESRLVDLMGQYRSTFRRQLLVILCIHAAIQFFGDQQFDPYPSLSSARWTANHMILAQRFDLLAKTYFKLDLQLLVLFVRRLEAILKPHTTSIRRSPM